MDIDILLALQEFRNGAGAFLSGFLSKMTWLGEVNTVIVIMALMYWCFSKVQMFYVSFIFPRIIKYFEKE